MAFTDANLSKLHMAQAGVSPSIWTYTTTDTLATVDTAGYFTGGKTAEMHVGDVVWVVVVDSLAAAVDARVPAAYGHAVVFSKTNGVVNLGNFTAGSVTDTD